MSNNMCTLTGSERTEHYGDSPVTLSLSSLEWDASKPCAKSRVTSLQLAEMLDLPERSIQAVVYQVLARRDSFGTFPTVKITDSEGVDKYLVEFTYAQVADIVEYLEPLFWKILFIEMKRTGLPVLTRDQVRQALAKHLTSTEE